MAENQISKLMQTDIPAPGMSNFHFEPINRTSFSPFYGYPVHVQEILPNTNVRMNVDAIIKAEPTLGSLYGTFRMSMQAYFVPSRLYCKELDQNTRMGITNDILNEVKFPVIAQGAVFDNIDELVAGNYRTALGGISFVNSVMDESVNIYNPVGSLFDNLQMFPPDFTLEDTIDPEGAPGDDVNWFKSARGINAIPFVAYYDIYRNYYWNAQDHTDFFVGSESNTSTFLRDDYAWANIAEFADYLVDLVYSREPNKGTNEFWDAASTWNIQSTNTDGFNILEDVAVANFITDGFNTYTYSQSTTTQVHCHYWRRTYDDDYFTSRLDKGNIDVIDNSSLVRVSDNSFNVRQLKLAQRNYRYGTKNNLTNSNRYDDLLNVHYGAKLNRALNIPHFLGSVSSDFYFEDIYAQSGENLGDRNGILNASLRTTDFVNFQAEEHGYLMVIFTLIPRIDYVGAMPKMYMKDTFADVYKPEYDAVGFQEITLAEIVGPVTTDASDIVLGMQPSWFEYMATFNHVHGNFTLDEKKFNTITRRFNVNDPNFFNGFTTYGEPWALNYLFKETANWKDNFNGQFLFKVDCYQPMSKQIVSFF